jgi:hypothetical protein
MEIWKEYPFNTDYSVSTEGRIKNNKTGTILKDWWTGLKTNPYRKIQVGSNRWCRMPVHRVVAETWCLKMDDTLEVDHLNKNRSDNRAINLQWVSHKENCIRKFKKNITV